MCVVILRAAASTYSKEICIGIDDLGWVSSYRYITVVNLIICTQIFIIIIPEIPHTRHFFRVGIA